ncbi:MAG: ABC transporter ATP-binding protein [Pseudomonadota bacterium]
MSHLTIRDLRVTFVTPTGPLAAVNGVDLDVAPGEIVALVGQSGSGKSVIAMATLRLLPANATVEGQIQLDGRDLGACSPAEMRQMRGADIGLIPQNPAASLTPVLSVEMQMRETLRRHGRALSDGPDLLARMGLPTRNSRRRRYPFELSGGMKQRALAALGIAGRPNLLIADEPTKGLDARLRSQIVETLATARHQDDMSMLIVTHDLDVAFALADRVIVLRNGRIVEQGRARALARAPGDPYTRALVAAQPSRMPVCSAGPRRGPPILTADAVGRRMKSGGLFARPVTAVADASLTLAQGETLGLTGPSGCGKSTLARILLGLLRPDTGTIAHDTAGPLSRHAQLLSQHPETAFDPRWRLERSVAEPFAIHRLGGPRATRAVVRPLLEALDLSPDLLRRFPRQVSGGQLQRLALVRALLVQPKVLILDEPTSMLDVLTQAQVMGAIRDLQDTRDLACLFISHDLDLAAAFSHRIAVMEDGRIVETAPSGQLRHAPQSDAARRLTEAFDAGRARVA